MILDIILVSIFCIAVFYTHVFIKKLSDSHEIR